MKASDDASAALLLYAVEHDFGDGHEGHCGVG